MPSLNDLLYDLRRIEAHREKLSDKRIKKIYESLIKDLNHFLSDEFFRYANRNGVLSYDTLEKKIREAKFLEEIIENVDSITPEIQEEILTLVEETYKSCYIGMSDAIKRSSPKELAALFSKSMVNPSVLKSTFENGLSKLTLPSLLQIHRSEIIYQIKRELTIGLINGDRQDVMINKIAEKVGFSHKKAANVVRTESHRNVESGFYDSAFNINGGLVGSGYIMVTTWRTMKDEKVRPQQRYRTKKGWKTRYSKNGANHMKMEGVAIKMGDKFKLEPTVETVAPSLSGVARHDCNERCFLEYDIMTEEEFEAMPNKQK